MAGANIFVTGGVGFIGEIWASGSTRRQPRAWARCHCAATRLTWSVAPPRSLLPAPLRAGSHTVLVLLEHGFKVCIMDNLDNSFQKAYDRMVELAGDKAPNMKFIKVGRGGCRRRRPRTVRRRSGHQASSVLPAGCLMPPLLPAPTGRPAQPGGLGDGILCGEVSAAVSWKSRDGRSPAVGAAVGARASGSCLRHAAAMVQLQASPHAIAVRLVKSTLPLQPPGWAATCGRCHPHRCRPQV